MLKIKHIIGFLAITTIINNSQKFSEEIKREESEVKPDEQITQKKIDIKNILRIILAVLQWYALSVLVIHCVLHTIGCFKAGQDFNVKFIAIPGLSHALFLKSTVHKLNEEKD